jgi:hypothetical protein
MLVAERILCQFPWISNTNVTDHPFLYYHSEYEIEEPEQNEEQNFQYDTASAVMSALQQIALLQDKELYGRQQARAKLLLERHFKQI